MIDTVLLFLSMITALFWLVVAVGTTFSIRKIPTLPETTRTKYPSLSIIVAAKDEEKAIRESISSQLKQDYPNVEWVLVDDRSSDGTLSIMKQLAAKDERITVLSIEELPEGWLGKNHALYKGYKQASGELILFTDADVIYERTDVLKRSVAMLQTENVDHVTISPTLQAKSFMLQAFIGFFLFGFHYFKRPHRANDDRSSVAMGVGAFNLLRKEAYEAIGTHEQIRFRPDDDLQIGIQIKKMA